MNLAYTNARATRHARLLLLLQTALTLPLDRSHLPILLGGLQRELAREELVGGIGLGRRHDGPEEHAGDEGSRRAGDEPAAEDDGDELPVDGLGASVAQAHGNGGARDAVGGGDRDA